MDEMRPLNRRHWEEVGEDRLELDVDHDTLCRLEELGALHVMTAREGERLVGYCMSIYYTPTHYRGVKCADNDALYLAPEARGGTAGRKLIQEAVRDMLADGVKIVRMRVKTKRDFGPLLQRLGFVHTETVYSYMEG
jgi:GNAT superfamily N-acetyltransferase